MAATVVVVVAAVIDSKFGEYFVAVYTARKSPYDAIHEYFEAVNKEGTVNVMGIADTAPPGSAVRGRLGVIGGSW
jgi:hypothetical protein